MQFMFLKAYERKLVSILTEIQQIEQELEIKYFQS